MSDLKKFEDMPGPFGLPLVGSALQLSAFQERVLTDWGKDYYGKVFQYRLFSRRCIVLNGYEAVKEGLVTKADAMSGRMTGDVIKANRDNQGIFFANFGENWRKWRGFAAKAIHRSAEDMAKIIGNEARLFGLHSLDEACESGRPVSLSDNISTFAEVVFKICNSKKRGDQSSNLEELLPLIYAPFSTTKFLLPLFAPAVNNFPPFSGYLRNTTEGRVKIIQRLVAWIDDYKKDDTPGKNDILSVFYEENPLPLPEDKEALAYAILDMIFAGSATVAAQFSWTILFLVKNPEVQRRVQEEIDQNMENIENPYELYNKSDELPFINAVIQEVYRMRPIATTALQHETTAKTSVCGYEIPKGIVVFPNIWSVHHDKEFWGPDVDEFKPERHIADDGGFQKSDHVIPYSVGPRSCVGQMIARADLFIYLVSILHKYNLELVKESTELDMRGISGSILQPPPYKVKVTKR